MHFPTRYKAENGNVLFLILIAVALFAALSYAVTQSNRSGGGDASRETSQLRTLRLAQYGTQISAAITRLKVSHNCSDDQISFENPILNIYTNPNSPTDHSCEIFHPLGGGVPFEQFLDILHPHLGISPPNNIFFSSTPVPGAGTTAPDLVFMTWGGLTNEDCTLINQKLGVTNVVHGDPEWGDDGDAIVPFIGTFASNDYEIDSTSNPVLNSFCAYNVETAVSTPYPGAYVHVLMAR